MTNEIDAAADALTRVAPSGDESAALAVGPLGTGGPGWLDFIGDGYMLYFMTSLVIVAAVLFAGEFVPSCPRHPLAREGGFALRSAAWDGQWYAQIADQGYSYSPERMSSVAFPPAFPMLAAIARRVTGWPIHLSLLVVSHGFLLGSFVLMAAYMTARAPRGQRERAGYALLWLGVFPSGFYFRMAYSESMFLFLSLLAMFGMARKWPTVVVALVIGLATATRLAAVALVAPLAIHVWQLSATGRSFLRTIVCLAPVAGGGMIAFAGYQHYQFSDAMAFMRTSAHWNHREPASGKQKLFGLLSFEPLQAVYERRSPCYWGDKPPQDGPLFNLFFANPIYFLATAGLVVGGYAKGWLNGKEAALGAALLVIPYLTHAQRGCMASEARYASVVFPAYITLGEIFQRLPAPITAVAAALSACLMAAYAALFTSWYWFY